MKPLIFLAALALAAPAAAQKPPAPPAEAAQFINLQALQTRVVRQTALARTATLALLCGVRDDDWHEDAETAIADSADPPNVYTVDPSGKFARIVGDYANAVIDLVDAQATALYQLQGPAKACAGVARSPDLAAIEKLRAAWAAKLARMHLNPIDSAP
jgi:hypothetical protein